MNLIIRDFVLEDLEEYEQKLNPEMKFYKYDGPYYGKTDKKEVAEHISQIRDSLIQGKKPVTNRKLIIDVDGNKIVGHVNRYWQLKETNWLEVGIIIYDENDWGKGVGTKALKMWIDEVFDTLPELVRIGCSTWSGNPGMIKVAEKLGLKKEAEYRKALIVEGKYYNSISYGILKKEWYELSNSKGSFRTE